MWEFAKWRTTCRFQPPAAFTSGERTHRITQTNDVHTELRGALHGLDAPTQASVMDRNPAHLGALAPA